MFEMLECMLQFYATDVSLRLVIHSARLQTQERLCSYLH